MLGVLSMQVLDYARLSPLEVLVLVAGYLPGTLPFFVTRDVFVDGKH